MRLAMRLLTLLFFFASLSFAREQRALIDPSQIPLEASSISGFVPQGWKLEEEISGDLNNDSIPDYVLKLVEDVPAAKGDVANERQRALIIVFRNKDGKLFRAAFAGKLLQCTTCGGAFYGTGESPANIKIKKDVLIVDQDHGSREVSTETYRFRYEPDTKRFALIGFDFVSADRSTGKSVSESTNFLTGVRVVTQSGDKTDKTSRQSVSKDKIYIEQVDHEQFEAAAVERLHL